MSIDGSFSIKSALERFLARCPKLGSLPQYDYLTRKGSSVTEEQVVNLVAEQFLHPNYTTPLIGCFRPIARKIVDRAVALLHSVPNLRSFSEDVMGCDEVEINVIEFYVQTGRGLHLHELACLAFCRALDLAPFLSGSILTYFEFAPPPFERLLVKGTVLDLSVQDGTQLLLAARTSYRFLITDSEVFSTLWDWSCFLELVDQSSNLDLGSSAEFEKNIADIRWCGIQILSIMLNLSDRAVANFGVKPEEAFACFLRWQEFCHDVSLEKAGMYIDTTKEMKSNIVDVNSDFSHENCLQSFGFSSRITSWFHEPEMSVMNPRLERRDKNSDTNLFVLTSSLKKSYNMVLLAVSQKWPVLLYGPASSGKSALISKLASDSANQVLSIHMDDQIDGKTLIGSYVCTEQPGEFRWQPGSLTQAVQNGFWVIFEDIDKASSDVQSILLPLLEGASSLVTNQGEEIRVAESFRLFATISTYKLDASQSTKGAGSSGVLWRRVIIGPPSDDDLQDIVKAWFPNLECLAAKLIETFRKVNSASPLQPVGSQPINSACLSSLSRFSSRDLLKWCKRIAGLGFSFLGDGLSAYECHCIYQEAVDIFASFSTSVEKRLTTMKDIATIWAVPLAATDSLYPHDKPMIQDLPSELRIGRVTLQLTQIHSQKQIFVGIRSSLHVLEKIACSVKCNEPILLVGETGTGKTTLVQYLATRLGQRLTVLNLSQQSDVADLLGGFKPMDAPFICTSLYKDFEALFSKTFSKKVSDTFLSHLQKHLKEKNWKLLLSGFQKAVDSFQKSVEMSRSESGEKQKKPLNKEKIKAWDNFSTRLKNALRQVDASAGMVFSFVEGAFITALRNGEWVLLDEVNLAPPETLQRIAGVLEGENSSLCLAERGDANYICRNPNFRIFACMNPATDSGKRDLPYSLRSRFTEFSVDDVLDDEDLTLFISQYMNYGQSNRELVSKMVCFYKAAKKDSRERLQDGANLKPQYSLRSLYRALEYTRIATKKFKFQKAIYDGFCMFFLTLLDRPSAKIMNQMILSYLLGGKLPQDLPFDRYLSVQDYRYNAFSENYVLTKTVRENLKNLSRSIFIKRYPVLLQGPTSSGKTSLVQYLAAITGHEFVRINNHEFTDLQEYLGSYVTDARGKLVFHEGVLVKAVRNGYWIVLDELNLAPSDVLEALNRLLDDNRELYVPELGETVRAHDDFMLFATQNPPTFYGGRKMLSRAFRNRFVEIHVDEIPEDELSTILEGRCKIPKSHAKKMVEVMKDLQLHRQSSKIFAGKHGYITPRDLFRWADRSWGNSHHFEKVSYEDMARDGYYLLAERLRDDSEKSVVQEVLERHLHVKLIKEEMYMQESVGQDLVLTLGNHAGVANALGNVIWTRSMLRLYFLVHRCYQLREPVLLVGETGGGKTTVCQLLSIILDLELHILNCHHYTETSDFIGGFYPIRERSKLMTEYKYQIEQLKLSKAVACFPTPYTISTDIGQASSALDQLNIIINNYRQGLVSSPDVTLQDLDSFEQMKTGLSQLHHKWQIIFMWKDGPLVQAMKAGHLFLVDEISLADDSVLERLNSVLEPERKLSLAEKGGPVLEKITAHPNFLILATMNPGGDFGKKELSPALRNRFTEIWVPPVWDSNELRSIALGRLSNPDLSRFVDIMISFWEWFNQLQIGRMLTVRDLLSWVAFINATEKRLGPECAFLHGVFLCLLDGLSLGTGISKTDAGNLRKRCLSFLSERLKLNNPSCCCSSLLRIENYGWAGLGTNAEVSCSDDMQFDNMFGINPFYIEKGKEHCVVGGFEFLAPTTRRNALRLLRAMQLPKPVLLEGSPGVGKTSLIVSLGKFSGHRVVRINLSEQTDIMDLLGSDLPVESDTGMKFAWSDGILLQALKEGCWVLLDELNLAPQSVLEGLNALLDHRAEVFIPELGCTFRCPSSFRIFACQNPSKQGGGRKGLPKSFLNRFTKVYVDELVDDDYLFICRSLYPSIPRGLLSKLILFNKRLHEETMLYHKFAHDGSPWEFNLRDVIRSCEMIQGALEKSKPDCFLNILYVQRMRTATDRIEVLRIYEEVFEVKPFINPFPQMQLTPEYLTVGNSVIKRSSSQSSRIMSDKLKIIPGVRQSLEAAMHCVQHQWLCILIGPSSSGKTSLIRLLAQLTGNKLNELNLSSATDVSELLGCFEQYNAYREFRYVVSEVKCYMNEYCSLQSDSSVLIGENKDLFGQWLTFLSNMDYGSASSFASMHADKGKSIAKSLCFLLEVIEKLNSVWEKFDLPVSWSSKELNKIKNTISKLQEEFQRKQFPAKFVWVVGLLIKAIENGEWIVLENANLCNPSVLDRINSLVEPCGSVTVNECGTVDGQPVVMHPHPNFRIFLTVNPTYGEVSRAMRNRGVEIFLMPPYWLFEEGNKCSCEDFELKDVKRFLVESGIPVGKLVSSMAEAYVYAKTEGLRLSVHISYLELGHWVQLFQQLIINGNQPIWSLHISWEHIYLSSLGEAEGWDIVNTAKCMYLSVTQLSKPDSSWGYCLCLPGGWPMPLELRDFIYYSREASIIQNCSYLGFLGAQYASCSCAYIMDMRLPHEIMHAKASTGLHSDFDQNTDSKLVLADKMLFAANWAIEQVSQSDLNLYLLWFSWFGTQLEPFCNFFKSFSSLLEEEFEHPIWKCIHDCHRELKYLMNVDQDNFPMLSLDIGELCASDERLKMPNQALCRAIDCIGLLRLSFQQWSAERMYDYSDGTQCYKPMLKSLQVLEKKILDVIVSSPSFDLLLQLYTNLLDNHILFWKCVALLKCKDLPIFWRSLMKHIMKLQSFFPSAANIVLTEVKSLQNILHFNSHKSLLWVHGGHPFLPSSSHLHYKQHQLLVLCELLWPTERRKSWKHDNSLSKVVASFNPELRALAMQGICLSSYIVRKGDNDIEAVAQLENMYQMFMGRFDQEKLKLESEIGFNNHTDSEMNAIVCCGFFPDIFCRKSSLDSWLNLVPIIDWSSFFMDIELLEKLSSVLLLNSKALKLPLDCLRDLLDRDLNFSLKFSSRPPQCFSPHKKITLMLDGWGSVDAVDIEAASFVLEMWYRWHQYLWGHHPVSVKKVSSVDGYDGAKLYLLTHPVITSTIVNILEDAFSIKDYSLCCLKLEAASWSVWSSTTWAKNLPTFLLSAARSLFEQIISAHRRSFDAEIFAAIKSTLCSFKMNKVTKNALQHVSLLIASSSHQPLKSLVNEQIEPLLQELFLQCSSTDFNYNLGCAWLRIGGLRFHLLFSCGDIDPANKYSWKCSQLQEKISLLELEIKVRKECNYLAGSFATTTADDRRSRELENLKLEYRRIQRKVVFRSDSKMFKKLKHECGNFFNNHFEKFMCLVRNIGGTDVQQIASEVSSWQEDATCFIEQLSDKEYTSYADIIQPVQVAIYEMMLGLSLVLSSALQKAFLRKVEEDNMNRVMETIYAFMRFPRGHTFRSSANLDPNLSDISSFDMDFPQNSLALDTTLLEKLATVSSDASTSKAVSASQTKAALHLNILFRVALSIGNSRMIDKTSFMLLDKIFNEFANLWMSMKVQTKTRGDSDAQQYKFKPRAFTIDSVIEDDISGLDMFLSGVEKPEHEWSTMQETLLNNMVYIHNQLFGSADLVNMPGNFQVFDADRLLSFSNSYKLGVGMIKGLVCLSSSCLDAKLVPEHLFRLCLEHKEQFVSFNESTHKYNFYKDSNVPMLFKMFRSLTSLKQQILSHISEREDHAGLQKIVDVVEMLLVIPSTTPLAKALSGLRFLLKKIWALQENGSKFPLTVLEHIIALVSAWQKMEFDSWPALLDAVQDQYEIHAGKLWFPLYSVLQRSSADNIGGYTQSMIHSLEEFIHTSNIGEFRKRLQLLLAFHGLINAGKCFQTYSSKLCSDCIKENLMTLYNVFGFYVQFLPLILEHIETNRRNIEMELKDILKLCQWERFESVMPFENSKRTRNKFMKLIQKYNDLLQQPVMLILNLEAAKRAANFQSLKHSTTLNVFSENATILNAAMDLTRLKDEDRFTWLGNWKEKVCHALQNLHPGKTYESNTLSSEECSGYPSTCLLYQEEWTGIWHTLERTCESTSGCNSSWNNVSKKRLVKRRDLDALLKLLESSGLRSHGCMSTKVGNSQDQPNPFQLCLRSLGPSYDVHHLLLEQSRLSPGTVDSTQPRDFQGLPRESLDSDWKTVNEYYFKGMASVMVLQQVCMTFHEDFTLDQVNRSASFLDHLISIQQEQRGVAYSFAERLKRLQKYASALGTLLSRSSQLTDKTVSMCSISRNRDATVKCMWQQKLLFDSLYEISNEELLLLRTVESTHSNSCQNVKVAVNKILEFITKFSRIFLKSKESLDNFLLGHTWAIRAVSGSLRPHVVSLQEEQLVAQNFEVIKSFEEHLFDFRRNFDENSVEEALLFHFDDVLKKGKSMAEQFSSSRETGNGPTSSGQDASFSNHKDPQLGVDFGLALKRFESNAIDALKRLSSLSNGHALSEPFGNIATCVSLFETYVTSLNVDQLCDDLETIFCAEGLLSHSGHGVHLQHLHVLLDLLLDFGNGLLQDFLAVHKTVSIMTHVLANVFASIYSQGFGSGTEDRVDYTNQIDDEDQLLGTSEKAEERDPSGEVPVNDEKGIEMEQDFSVDACSVREDSGEDEDDQPESAMGETDREVIDESGSSVKDRDASSRELRAKKDGAATDHEPGDLNSNEADEVNDETDSQVDLAENVEDTKVDKEEAFADQSSEEDIDMDDKEVLASMEGASTEEHDESTENEGYDQEKIGSMEEAKTEQRDESPEKVTNTEMSLLEPRKDGIEPGSSDCSSDDVLNAESSSQAPESKGPGGNDVHSDPAATRGLPSDSTSKMDQQKTQLPQHESSAAQPNPYMDIWDALEEWKERVNVTIDLRTENTERRDEMEDEYADEALGPATLEQLDRNVNGFKPDGDDLPEIEYDKLNTETNHIECPALSLKHKMEQMQITDPENLSPEDHSQAESLVSVKKSDFCDDIYQISQLSVSDNEASKCQDMGEISTDVKNNAAALWRRCELRTTRLSQELAEQLRFVLEPTIASKLQGDYRTGKRMNMKKVIPYIASHYRKDKIWMRRTRPNKRDYQVVIAVDDSRSMSESGCGDVAIEALVTVCRAMSQLEMGNLAVASFGQNGNIRLLHDFNQPFTGEAGVKMISSFTFKQENTITDEPVVDLLKYLNNLLDDSLSKAWLPSGSNPLQQLVLIIADGRFHEKESLKRCVRDALSQKRMVAFLLLDSPQESIMDLMEASFQGGDIKFTKYLDSFPFPYYIVLKDIEALPRTLADLLRQWFELMQNSRD